MAPAAVLLTMSAYVHISKIVRFVLRAKVSMWALATPGIICIGYVWFVHSEACMVEAQKGRCFRKNVLTCFISSESEEALQILPWKFRNVSCSAGKSQSSPDCILEHLDHWG